MKSTPEEEPLQPQEATKDTGTPEGTSENAPVDAKKKIKKILMIAVPILLIIICGILFFFLVIKKPKHEHDGEVPQPTKGAQLQLETNTYLDIDPITVGLSQVGEKKEYLRIDLTIRLNTQAENNIVLAKMPIIKDSLITFLRTLRSSDFNSSSSTIYLKEEIAKRINKITSPIVIKEVLFQEITIN